MADVLVSARAASMAARLVVLWVDYLAGKRVLTRVESLGVGWAGMWAVRLVLLWDAKKTRLKIACRWATKWVEPRVVCSVCMLVGRWGATLAVLLAYS